MAPKRPRSEPVDPFTPQALEALVDTLVPEIERHAGRAFVRHPEVRLTEDPDFVTRVAEEQAWILARVIPDTPEDYRAELAERSARALQVGVLGKYGMLDKVVYLHKDALLGASDPEDGQPLPTSEVLTLVLAHELTHALQDQVHPLATSIDRIHDLEHLTAASACWEGLAGYVAQQVAVERKSEDTFWSLTRMQGWDDEGLRNPAAWDTWFTYGQGLSFMTDRATGGPDGLWTPIATPPGQTRDLFHADDWSSAIASPPRDYAAVLKGVEQTLTRGAWEVANTRIGESTLRGEAVWSPSHEAQLAELLDALVWAHGLVLDRPDRGGQIRVLEFRSEAAADAWMDLQQQQRQGYNRATSQALGVAVEVQSTPFPDVQADRALSRVERIPIGGGRHEERHAVWARRGRIVVSVAGERFRPGMRLGWTAEAVFERLDASNSSPTP